MHILQTAKQMKKKLLMSDEIWKHFLRSQIEFKREQEQEIHFAALKKEDWECLHLIQHISHLAASGDMNWFWPIKKFNEMKLDEFCSHEWRHSMMVVASMKYPPHRTHMRWGLSSVIFILVVRCMLRGRNNNPCTQKEDRSKQKHAEVCQRTAGHLDETAVCLDCDKATSTFMPIQK